MPTGAGSRGRAPPRLRDRATTRGNTPLARFRRRALRALARRGLGSAAPTRECGAPNRAGPGGAQRVAAADRARAATQLRCTPSRTNGTGPELRTLRRRVRRRRSARGNGVHELALASRWLAAGERPAGSRARGLTFAAADRCRSSTFVAPVEVSIESFGILPKPALQLSLRR